MIGRLLCWLGRHDWKPLLPGLLGSYGPDFCARCGKDRGIPIMLSDDEEDYPSHMYLLDPDGIELNMPPPYEIKDGDTEGTYDRIYLTITEGEE